MRMRKTQAVQELVQDVLRVISRRSATVINTVFQNIEDDPHGLGLRYDALVIELGQRTVNQWIGKYTSLLTPNFRANY